MVISKIFTANISVFSIRISFGIFMFGMLVVPNVKAEDTTNGYVLSIYGHAIKSAYGHCVHTAYYDPQIDQRAECDDIPVVASAPVTDKPKESDLSPVDISKLPKPPIDTQ